MVKQQKKGNKRTKKLSLQDEKLKEIQQLNRQAKDLEDAMRKKRVKKLKEDAAADDLEIKKLEKQLGLNKRRDKSKLNYFASDGLDYIIDVCNHKTLREAVETEKRFKEDDNDFGEDLAKVLGQSSKKRGLSSNLDTFKNKKHKASKDKLVKSTLDYEHKSVISSDSEPDERLSTKVGSQFIVDRKLSRKRTRGEDDNMDVTTSEDNFSGENNRIDFDSDRSSDEDNSLQKRGKKHQSTEKQKEIRTEQNRKIHRRSAENKGMEFDFSVVSKTPLKNNMDKSNSDGVWEDIYGRTRDKEGNVVTKYQPPHLRKILETGGVNHEMLQRLKKQMKGLLNRLAENNMVSIASQVESLYSNHSRNEMNETLWNLFKESLLGDVMSPDRLVAEHAMLLAVLAANVGGEVSSYCLHKCVLYWHELWSTSTSVENKATNNVLLLLSYMYLFKLFHCTLLYDILEKLLENVTEKEVELVLLVLRTIGFFLRKEDPVRLKNFVLKAQELANRTTSATEGCRVRFLLDTVLAIKNNNMAKIPNYNPEYAEHLKKSLKTCVRKGNYTAELKVTLEDLLKAEERGRWWVVGSAWTGELPGEKALNTEKKTIKKQEEGFSSQLLELARRQRMNTDTRRTVFCVLMSAEDYLDAFEKLLKLGLKGPTEREIMNVLLHCLLQEKQFNPYYEHLARKFCLCNRRFQVMLQFAAWDRIQDLKSLSSTQVTNLAKFLGNLIVERNLAITVLKVIEFGEMDKPSVRFIRQVLLAILLTNSEEAMLTVFARIAGSKPLKLFREGLRLFLHHFVLRNSKDVPNTNMAHLTLRVKLADSALSASERNLAF